MERIYIQGDEAKFIRKDTCKVDVIFFDGNVIENVEPRRLFPVSGPDKYITLLDSDNKEQALIVDIAKLMPESKEVIEECLREYYLVPKILKLTERSEKYGILKWTCETNRGMVTFAIQNRHSDIKIFFDGRVLVRDTNDNRYEIDDWNKLDRHSKQLLGYDL